MGIAEKIIHSDALHAHIYKEGVFWMLMSKAPVIF
jgi:hypothetical protein